MVIESTEEFNIFLDLYQSKQVIIIPILRDNIQHAAKNPISFLFVKFIDEPEYYILPFNHNECINLPILYLEKLDCDNKKYVLDKKTLMHTVRLKNLLDINILHYLKTNASYDADVIIKPSTSQYSIQSRFNDIRNINGAIPILKYYEILIKAANELEYIIKDAIKSELELAFQFLNGDTIECLYNIEKEGLHVDKKMMLEFFPQSKPYIDSDDLIYTQYNMYTATGRPANRFGNINFAALNKDNGERACFTSRHINGKLIMFDYDAYHLMLMADIVGYKFPTGENVHEYLGKMYFDKQSLTPDEYKQSKEVSFQLLYGGIDQSIADVIPFFAEVKKFLDTVWKDTNIANYYETIISKKKIWLKNFDFLNKNKLFNYILQNYETDQNILTIKQIQSVLSTRKSKLILYLYDGFLLDMHPDDIGLESEIKNILQKNGTFPAKTFVGKDFYNLLKIE